MPNIPFAKIQTLTDAALFLKTHGKIVAKPTKGFGALDIHVITEESQLQSLRLNRYIFEKYIGGKEMRFVILNDEVIVVHESLYGTSVAADRYLERISFPEDEWDPELVATARKAMQIFELNFGVVDFLVDPFGRAHILELNTTPGLHWLHEPTSGPPVDVARMFLESILNTPKTAALLAN
jgi:D-alanine-D-alanine ligase-like ATP-grasp enzyme